MELNVENLVTAQQNERDNLPNDNTISAQMSYSQSSTVSISIDVTERMQNNETPETLASSQNSDATTIKNSSTEIESEPPSKKPKLDDTVDEEGSLCVICYEVWGQTGDHRITSLKCGHLFGHKCILRWLGETKVCPTCKKHATKRDIRFIYANKLVAMDTGELTRLQTELDSVKSEKSNLEIELTSVVCKLTMVTADVERYKGLLQEYMSMSKIAVEQATSNVVEKSFNLKYLDGFMVCPQGSCRVMDYIPSKSSIVASLKSPNSLFSGFGVKQFNSETFALLSYTPLHSKVIRDLRFNQSNARLLSVSLDKHFSIANIYSNENNIKQGCDDMLWSCCWDATNPNIFYVGGQQGTVKVYDSRYISQTPISTHSIEGDMSPVVSIVSVPSSPGGTLPLGGFIACKLNSLWAFEKTSTTMRKHLLPIEGPFISMSYNEYDKHLLVSARPNAREPTARNIICNLHQESADVLSCNRVHTFSSGKLQKQLARSCFVHKDGYNYVATPNDSRLQLWNSQTGYQVTVARTTSTGPIIDLLPLKNNHGSHLLALAEKKLHVFKLIDS